MTTKNRPIRKKPKSNVPILMKLPKAQQEAIKRPPRISLNRFKQGIADATDWYNIGFRICVGLQLAKSDYVQETVDGVEGVYTLWKSVFERAKAPVAPNWIITENEVLEVEEALDAVDAMQDDTLRRSQLDAHLTASKILKSYVRNFDEYLASLKK